MDGRTADRAGLAAVGRTVARLLTSAGEREEAVLEARLQRAGNITRPNVIAVISPKGGMGKTTCTFVLGSLLASRRRLRVLAVDANRDFGTLAGLATDDDRSELTAIELLSEMDSIHNSAELRRFVTPLATGLHVLAAPVHPEVMAAMTPEHYGQLLSFVTQYYEVVLLDLGTGIVDPLAQFAVQRADQVAVVTTPEFLTAERVLQALRYLGKPSDTGHADERLLVVANQVPSKSSSPAAAIARALGELGVTRQVGVPFDAQLKVMLDSGTYTMEALRRPSRMAVRELGVLVAQKLV